VSRRPSDPVAGATPPPWVPGNRWDLLGAPTGPPPRIGVVVCHYRQRAALVRTVAALHRQTLRPVAIVVADDGSPRTPEVSALTGPVPVRVVTQPDRGFRAAAARNRGVAAVDGDVLVMLDADTVPGPGFLAALATRLAAGPDVLVVGRRRHADLSGTAPGDDPAAAPRLPERRGRPRRAGSPSGSRSAPPRRAAAPVPSCCPRPRPRIRPLA